VIAVEGKADGKSLRVGKLMVRGNIDMKNQRAEKPADGLEMPEMLDK
jgi:hypothetical protein